MKHIVILLVLSVLFGGCPAWALDLENSGSRGGQVTVSSSTSGVQVTNKIRQNLKVSVPANAAGSVCFGFVDNGTACSTITNPALFAPCIPPGQAYEWPVRIYGWEGQVCSLLESGSTPVVINWRDPN